jgi:CBS domain-containing protein
MNAGDVMTRRVISISPDASIWETACLMLQNNISGVPVIDAKGNLVGIVTERDCLRRVETGTERRRPRWLEFLRSSGQLAGEYVHAHGRRVAEVMTPDVLAVTEGTSLEQIVHLMESRRIKRVPVLRGSEVVGIVSRANLLRALAALAPLATPVADSDSAIRAQVLAEFDKEAWAPHNCIDVTVRNGDVDLWGVVIAAKQREAAVVAAENVPGVKLVRSHLAWVEPMSAMVFFENEKKSGETPPVR